MSWLHGFRHRLRALLAPGAHARAIEEEMQYHRELAAMHEDSDRDAALRFGNSTFYREEVRRMTWFGAFDAVRQDARFAWRSVVRKPGFTAGVVLTLALGIGLNAASFSMLDMLFLRQPGGVVQPEAVRRVYVEHFNTGDGVPTVSQALNYPMFREVATAIGDSTKVALFAPENALRMGRSPRDPVIRGVYASANYFDVLGARAVIGRTYAGDEDQMGSGVPVAVVSHRFWRTQLGADSAVVGRIVEVDTMRYTIVGVLDPAFSGIEAQAADIWMPLATLPVGRRGAGARWWESQNPYRFRALYRVEPGMHTAVVDQRATQRIRAFNREQSARGDTLMNVYSGSLIVARGPAKAGYQTLISTRLSGVAILVLLIACANVINLLLARSVRRRHEFAVRLALGISRARLIRLLTTETLLLALLATLPAILFAWWGGSLLRTLLMPDVEWYGAALTWRVALFAFGMAALAGLIAGLVPAMQSSRPELTNALKAGARSGGYHRSAVRTGLVVTQAALSLVLLTGAALFIRSLQNVQGLDIGFDANRLLFGSVQFARGDAMPRAVYEAAIRDVVSKLQGRPDVESVALVVNEPMRAISFVPFFAGKDSIGSFPGQTPTVSTVSPAFFRTVGMRVLQGQGFSGSELQPLRGQREVVVNEAFARRLWPDGNVLGQCMQLQSREAPCHTVVAVVENARRGKVIEEDAHFQFYLALGDSAGSLSGDRIIVRTSGPVAQASMELRNALAESFPSGFPAVKPMMENLEPEYRPWRLGATLFTGVGVLALVVALIGIYSTVSYGVTQRTHEFGVRIALGAQVRDLLTQVVGEGVRTVLIGVSVGVLLALGAGRLVSALLYGIDAHDPVTMIAVAVALLLAAALAAVIPAWRASRVDPVTALRVE